MQLNDNIKLIRELSGLKQVDFAKSIKTKLSNLKTYETTNTKPKAPVLTRIAKIAGVTIEELKTKRLKAEELDIKVDKVENEESESDVSLNGKLGLTAKEYITELRNDKKRLEKVIDANLTALVTMLSALHRHDVSNHQVMLRSLARIEKLKNKEQLISEADRIEAEVQRQETGKGTVNTVNI